MSRRLAAAEGLPKPDLSETEVVNSAVELSAYGGGVSYVGARGSLVARPFDDKGLKIFADARNINDAEAREHASFLRDLAPLPGHSFRIGAGYTF